MTGTITSARRRTSSEVLLTYCIQAVVGKHLSLRRHYYDCCYSNRATTILRFSSAQLAGAYYPWRISNITTTENRLPMASSQYRSWVADNELYLTIGGLCGLTLLYLVCAVVVRLRCFEGCVCPCRKASLTRSDEDNGSPPSYDAFQQNTAIFRHPDSYLGLHDANGDSQRKNVALSIEEPPPPSYSSLFDRMRTRFSNQRIAPSSSSRPDVVESTGSSRSSETGVSRTPTQQVVFYVA